jgi:hypothetical protein
MRNRGQISGTDLAIAMIIMAFLIFAILEAWIYALSKTSSHPLEQGLQARISDASELLVKTEGAPGNWEALAAKNPESIESLGLAGRPNVLCGRKLKALGEMEYDDVKKILGVTQKNLHIVVVDERANSILYEFGRALNGPNMRLERPTLLEGNLTSLQLTIYRPGAAQG